MPKLDHVITITIIEILGSQEIYISVTRAFNSMSMTRLTSSVMHSQLYTILTFWLVDYLENQVRNIQLFIICNTTVYSWFVNWKYLFKDGEFGGRCGYGEKMYFLFWFGKSVKCCPFFLCWMYFVFFGLNYLWICLFFRKLFSPSPLKQSPIQYQIATGVFGEDTFFWFVAPSGKNVLKKIESIGKGKYQVEYTPFEPGKGFV